MYITFTDSNVTLQVHFWAIGKPKHGVYRGICVAQLLIVRELRDYMSIAGTPGKQKHHSYEIMIYLRSYKNTKKSEADQKKKSIAQIGPLVESPWAMVTESGTFLKAKLIKPCLDLNLRPKKHGARTFTTVFLASK